MFQWFHLIKVFFICGKKYSVHVKKIHYLSYISVCSYIGQLLSDGDSGCTYRVCKYAPRLNTDSQTGRLTLQSERVQCPGGTAVPRGFPIGYGAPCTVFSTQCKSSKVHSGKAP